MRNHVPYMHIIDKQFVYVHVHVQEYDQYEVQLSFNELA